MESTIEKVGEIAVVQVNYESLDAGSVNDFKADLEPIVQDGGLMVLDLSHTEYIDSAGLGAVVSTLKRLRGAGGDIRVCGLSKAVRALFELVRMHKLLDVYHDRDEALASYSA